MEITPKKIDTNTNLPSAAQDQRKSQPTGGKIEKPAAESAENSIQITETLGADRNVQTQIKNAGVPTGLPPVKGAGVQALKFAPDPIAHEPPAKGMLHWITDKKTEYDFIQYLGSGQDLVWKHPEGMQAVVTLNANNQKSQSCGNFDANTVLVLHGTEKQVQTIYKELADILQSDKAKKFSLSPDKLKQTAHSILFCATGVYYLPQNPNLPSGIFQTVRIPLQVFKDDERTWIAGPIATSLAQQLRANAELRGEVIPGTEFWPKS